MIINHVSVGVSELSSAIEYYDKVLATLNITRSAYVEGIAASYGSDFEFWIGLPHEGEFSTGNGVHIAFNASSIEAVGRFYQAAISSGGVCKGKPGYRPEYGEGYYAAFVTDLDGNKLEAVIIKDD
ncbi:VOC family protein [Vibrio sonorensis]|uniref:VOC family protein n=1 Tax=Vibrio sonorensis TaxID=1004316 RepID=UPI0008DA2505|nr:VOC family protein [Vibrio sonorensis]